MLCRLAEGYGAPPLWPTLPPAIFGTASGFTNMMAILAGAIAQQIVGVLLTFTWNHQSLNGVPVYEVSNYQVGILVLPIAAIIGLAISWFKLKETHCVQIYPEV